MKTCPRCNKAHNNNGTFCSRSCANARVHSDETKEKTSKSVKKHLAENGHHNKGKPGWSHSDSDKELKRIRSKESWDKRERKETSEKERKAARVAGVQAYRAKKYGATPENVDRKLINKIYENCPSGYEVDHIVALCNGGPHHEDNLQYLPAMENRRKNRTDNYDRSLVIRWQDILK